MLEHEARTRLGVGPEATLAEIKRRYRRLARAYHTDLNPGADPARFREVDEAFKLLDGLLRRRPDPPPREWIPAKVWLVSVGVDVDVVARQLASRIVPDRDDVVCPFTSRCDAVLHSVMGTAWKADIMGSGFSSWLRDVVERPAVDRWHRAFRAACDPVYVVPAVLEAIMVHCVARSSGIEWRGPAPYLVRVGRSPKPALSHEARIRGLMHVVQHRVDMAVRRQVRETRFDLERAFDRRISNVRSLVEEWFQSSLSMPAVHAV